MCSLVCVLSALSLSLAAWARPHGIITDANLFSRQKFDFVVIGGGTAGLAVASRLSELSTNFVGVIEAGTYQPGEDLIDIPAFIGSGLGNASLDWNFETKPQLHLGNRSIHLAVGKVLGGSSSLNFLQYMRGSRGDYDAWAALGNKKWTWNSLFPYFNKAENVTVGDVGINPDSTAMPGSVGRGTHGPLSVSYNTKSTFLPVDILRKAVESFRNIGSYLNENPESGNNTGIWISTRTVNPTTGRRTSSVSCINHNRKNLLILTGAHATKIKFSRTQKAKLIASAVNFQAAGKKYSVRSTKEVILSAGAIKTPQLLELSGIGDEHRLRGLKIPVYQNLPGVGENLQDHMLIYQDFLLKEPAPTTWDIIRNNLTVAAQQQTQYTETDDGYYASSTPVFAFHPLQDFMNTISFKSTLDALDTEISAKASSLTPMQKAQYPIQRQLLADGEVGQIEFAILPSGGVAGSALPGRSYLTFPAFISRPFSRGSTHVNSTDALVNPTVDPCYFCFAFDKAAMILAVKTIRRVSEQLPLAELIERPSSPPQDVDFSSFVEQSSSTVYHPSGTAAMAPREIGGVVNEELIVYGTANLRIVDLSISPLLFASHPQSTVYAIAEKAADLIKALYSRST